jgi:mRNA-degrading endonuclease toxin of MazEF toxin-antitoxin module
MRPNRGEIYALKGGPDSGGKRRPVLIISNDVLNGGHSVLAIPFYSQQLDKRRGQKWCAEFAAGEAGLAKDCVAKTDEITLIDKLDIDLANGYVGKLDDSQLQRVIEALKWSLVID